jgi:hypothetical protein
MANSELIHDFKIITRLPAFVLRHDHGIMRLTHMLQDIKAVSLNILTSHPIRPKMTEKGSHNGSSPAL